MKNIRPATMFAIAYDFDTALLKANYPNPSFTNAYGEFRKFMESHGFQKQQGSVLYGDDTVTSVTAILAVVAASRKFNWLAPSLSDIRILQLMNNDDLMPAVNSGATPKPAPAVPAVLLD